MRRAKLLAESSSPGGTLVPIGRLPGRTDRRAPGRAGGVDDLVAEARGDRPAIGDVLERVAVPLEADQVEEQPLAQEAVPAEGDPVVVGRVLGVDAGEVADVIDAGAVPDRPAHRPEPRRVVDLVAVAAADGAAQVGVAGPVVDLPLGADDDGQDLRPGEGRLARLRDDPGGGAVHDQPARDRRAVGEPHLQDPRRAQLLDVREVEGVNAELVAVELELPVVHRDDLTLEPFVRREPDPVEVRRQALRGLRLPGLLGVVGSGRRCGEHQSRQAACGQAKDTRRVACAFGKRHQPVACSLNAAD